MTSPATFITPVPLTRRLLLFTGLWLLLSLLPGRLWAAGPPRELVIGMQPEHNIFTQMERYGRLARYLSEKSGIAIRLTIMSRYGEVLQRFKALRLDGAFLNSYTAAMTIDRLGMEPMVMTVNLAGDSTSRGLILTRHDSGITGFTDIRGKTFAFVDPATTDGYLFPLTLLKKHGVTDIDAFLGRHFFTGSHASAVSAVLDGRADLGAVKGKVYQQMVAKDPSIARELLVLWQSPPAPDLTLCVKRDLPADLKRRLADTLLNMDKVSEGREILKAIGEQRFIPATSQDFNIVREMARNAGITDKDHQER